MAEKKLPSPPINEQIQAFQKRVGLTVAYAMGFVLAHQNKSWWALPESLVITFICLFIFNTARIWLKRKQSR